MPFDYKEVQKNRKDARDIKKNFPDKINWKRRRKCWNDLALFLKTYFPTAFEKPWSEDHLRVINRLQNICTNGGLSAIALPRSSGKTTICERTAIWAILTGKRRFVCLIAATQDSAERLLQHIKTELQYNELLMQDFPSCCYPIAALENEARRCAGQLYDGENTLIGWQASKIVLPTIDRKDSSCNGAVISTAGLTSDVRGQNHVLSSGEIIRPDILLLDDVQTRTSAASNSQTNKRLEIISGDVLGLGGIGKAVSAMCCCTVIYKDDLSDQLLDRTKNPIWSGEKCKLLNSMPTNAKLWDEYKLIREECYRLDEPTDKATEFYKANQAAMDEGAVPAWKDRYNEDEISAIQHAMNLYFRDPFSFAAEYQNEPLTSAGNEQELPSVEAIMSRTNNLKKNVIPMSAKCITAFIDVQQTLLYYVVMAFEDDFTSNVVDYGSYPDQKRLYFTLNQAKNTLQNLKPKSGYDGQIWYGFEQLTELLTTEGRYKDENNVARHIDRIFIDANYGNSTKTVYKFCKESPHARILMPAHGRFVSVRQKPYSQYRKVRGEFLGHHWHVPLPDAGKVRHINNDINYWKSFVFNCLTVQQGDPGAMTLWGDSPGLHKMFAEQMRSECCLRVMGNDRVIDEWKLLPYRPDNHFLDCVVGCYCGASLLGVQVNTGPKLPVKKVEKSFKKKEKVSYIQI